LQELARHSPVPVLNALSSLWHPMQILADFLTLHEHAHLFSPDASLGEPRGDAKTGYTPLPELRPLTIAWLGDSNNILHDMLVTYPRFGHKVIAIWRMNMFKA
jgi:ornithine carbamoyltransferase